MQWSFAFYVVFLYISYNPYSDIDIWKCLIFYRYHFSFDFYLYIFCDKVLFNRERKKSYYSLAKREDDRGEEIHVYLVDKDYREYEACSKILDLLEGNETIEVIIKNRDIPIVSSDSALLPRWSYVDSIIIG